jgi:acrylyl-CoA reductase (NADPH)
MSDDSFKALLLRDDGGKTVSSVENITRGDLPEGDVLVRVDYSSLNFKDALAITGKGKIVRTWPMVPGIDLAGSVLESDSPDYRKGDAVVLTGWSVGERYWGGYSQQQRVRSEWLVPLPEGLDSARAMAIGTAGFTGMLCVMALEEAGITPQSGAVLVTGAAGGVGSVAVSVLAKLGYEVTALTGNPASHDYVRALGATHFADGEEWSAAPRALETQRWAAAVDTVGTKVLARVLAEMDYGGVVAACGLAGGADLATTVMPFILRGVTLRGVDSVMCPVERRKRAWERLFHDLSAQALEHISHRVVSLDQVFSVSEELLAGKLQGRVVVDVNA